jgi:ribose transport system permease protein
MRAMNKKLGFKADQQMIVLLIASAIFVVFSFTLSNFASVGNLVAMVRSIAVLAILGLGMAIVVIGRGIDLSMVALMAVPSALTMTLVERGMSLTGSITVGVTLAAIVGVINGVLIAYAEIPALFVTLAMGLALAGLGQIGILKADVVSWSGGMDPIRWLGGSEVLGVPSSVLLAAAMFFTVNWFLKRTKIGRFIYSVGDNPHTARTTGVMVRPIMVLQYVLAALIAVLAGFVMASSNNLMDTRTYNLSLIYDIILVVVLGGIGLSGGRGGVWSVLAGTLLVGIVFNGMTIMNFPLDIQDIFKGIILLIAITVDSFLNPRNEETAQQGDI